MRSRYLFVSHPQERPLVVTGHLTRLKAVLADTYRIERETGHGGMAVVFLARDLKHDRPVAIKVLQPEVAASLGHERFLREIEIAAKLQHPHILPVYDSGEADGVLYYVMPYVEGESLLELLSHGALPPREAIRIAREIADALDYAHRHGVVHRDIKPANVLLSEGHAVVADFGIARALSASAHQAGQHGLTQAGLAIGTPAYMSPEQALGGEVDGRSDIYALGILLFEMLSGRPPYVGTTPQAVISQTLTGEVPSLPDDRRGFDRIVQRALAREPRDRYATAAEFSASLDEIVTGSGPTVMPVPSRRRTAVSAIVMALVAIVAFVFWPREFRADGNPRHSLIIFPFENKTGDATRDYLGEASMNLLGLAASHWADLRVHDDERTASLLRRNDVTAGADIDFDAAQRMAREANVGTLVMGDIRREGDSLAIEAKVHDVRTGDRIATHIVRAAWGTDPRPLFDQLAGLLLGTSGAPPGERPSVLAQTTTSIEAYRNYLLGSTALQRFEVDSAKLFLSKAVAQDSAFALAYLRLRDAEGWALGNTRGDPDARRRYVLAAERHSSHLPPRLKALVAFHRAYEDGQYLRARAIVDGLIAKDSTDVEAWYQLGEAHYHDRSGVFPHADTLGNVGRALHAFQQTLALDSTYTLAYQHILDALATCAGSTVWVCLPDSAAYGPPEELRRQFGDAFLARRQTDAREAQVGTARGWVASAPSTQRARLALAQVLTSLERYDEAQQELVTISQLGGGAQAGMLKAQIVFRQTGPGAAATTLDSALSASADTLAVMTGQQNFAGPMVMLAGGGGRVAAGLRLVDATYRASGLDSVPGPGGVTLSRRETDLLYEAYLFAEVADPRAGRRGTRLMPMLARKAGRDTTAYRRSVISWGAISLMTFLTSRDTILLTPLLQVVDTTASATWRVADAHVALARGDTAHARARVETHFRRSDDNEFAGEQGVVRAFAWGDLLARLGDLPGAISAYGRIDSSASQQFHPGLLVRSFAERAAIAQAMGDIPTGIDFYQRFLKAWEAADPELQPAIEKARNALAALRGEVREPVKG